MSQQQQQQQQRNQHAYHEGTAAHARVAARYAAPVARAAAPEPAPARKPSREQVRANKRNAKRSTGPRTDAGKRVAARNAVTHGVFSKDAVLPGERRSEYVAFRNLLFNSPGLMPQDWLELSIAEQYVLAKWRIRRMQRVEMLVHHDVAMLAAEGQVMETEELERASAAAAAKQAEEEEMDEEDARHRAWVRSLLPPGQRYPSEEDAEPEDDAPRRRLQRRRREFEVAREQAMPIHATMAAALTFATHQRGEGASEGVDAFERIARSVYRLELSAARAMRELRQLRKEKGVDVNALVSCPFIDPMPEDDEDADRPPTPDEQRAIREERERQLDSLRNIEALLEVLRRPESEREYDDQVKEDEDEEAQRATNEEDANDRSESAGVLTSVSMSEPTGTEDTPTAPLQNEPNPDETVAGDGGDDGCAQGSRRIEIVEPTKVVGREVDHASRDGKEGGDPA